MNLSNNTVLITGGSSGIGLAFAERLLRGGSEVVICGRREEKLRQAKEKHPRLHTRVCDVGDEDDRIALFEWATHEFPQLNVLVNNAGVQRRIDFVHTEPWHRTRQEIAINLEAPMHLALPAGAIAFLIWLATFITHRIRWRKRQRAVAA